MPQCVQNQCRATRVLNRYKRSASVPCATYSPASGTEATVLPAGTASSRSAADHDAIRQIQFQYHSAAMARPAVLGQDGGGADLFDQACAFLDAMALNFWCSPCGDGIPCGSVMAYPNFLN